MFKKNKTYKIKRVWVRPDSSNGGLRIVNKISSIKRSCVFCNHSMIAGLNVVCLNTVNNLGIVNAGDSCTYFKKIKNI